MMRFGSICLRDTVSLNQAIENEPRAVKERLNFAHQPAPYNEAIRNLPRSPIPFYCICMRFGFLHSGDVVLLKDALKFNLLAEHLDRLELGIILTFEATNLYGTSWIRELRGLGKDYIFFRSTDTALGEDGNPTQINKSALAKPLVRCRDEQLQQDQDLPEDSQGSTQQDSIFLRSLGLLLVELWFGARMATICPDELWIDDITIMSSSIDNLLAYIEREDGPKYAETLRFCFRGINELETPVIERTEFRSKVKAEVVLKLVQNLNVHKLLVEQK
ncbi:hypothetical protein FPQ18DRAFT_101987 [Pyronema domesticum]|nr:hypothetical protein FPQ18DRAFT_101987 [Pyronema domesticum]